MSEQPKVATKHFILFEFKNRDDAVGVVNINDVSAEQMAIVAVVLDEAARMEIRRGMQDAANEMAAAAIEVARGPIVFKKGHRQ